MSFLKRRESFENIESWYKESKQNVSAETIFVLVGSKNDLVDQRQVEFQEGMDLQGKLKLDLFFETSSKSGENIEEIFSKAATEILQHNFSVKEMKDKLLQNNRFLEMKTEKKNKKGCC
jgi:GTPase SAR1 family protein